MFWNNPKGVSSLHDWGKCKLPSWFVNVSPESKCQEDVTETKTGEGHLVSWSSSCDSGSQIRLSLWWLCEDTNCFHLTSAWSRRAGCVIYKGGLPWKSPPKINPFLSIFNQDMPDGFCSGKIDADCCLRYHVPTVEYVNIHVNTRSCICVETARRDKPHTFARTQQQRHMHTNGQTFWLGTDWMIGTHWFMCFKFQSTIGLPPQRRYALWSTNMAMKIPIFNRK